jgi:competence protein ComEC
MITLRIKYAYNRFLASPTYQILINNFFLLAMMLLICGLSFIYPMMWLGTLILEITLWRRHKIFGIISLIISIAFIGCYFMNEWIEITPSIPFNGIITDEEQATTYQKLLIQGENTKLIVYSTAEVSFRIGDKVCIIGDVGEPTVPHLPGGFDYAEYLKLHHISGTIKTDNITKIGHPWSIWWFKDALNQYLEHCFPEEARVHIKGLLFGDRSGFNEEFSDSLSDNGLVHLFAVSGLHIGLIIGMISWLFQKLKWKSVNTFLIVLLAIYMIVTAFAPSIVRAILMFYLTLANKRFGWRLSSLDVISIVFIGLMLINPYYLLDIGFCLSFLVATMIIMLSPHLRSYKNWQQVLIISFASQWLTLPIIINFRHEFNVLSFVGSILFIYLVSYIILPMALVTFCCSFFSIFYDGGIHSSFNPVQ